MRVKSIMLTVGCLPLIAATTVVIASARFLDGMLGVEAIDSTGSQEPVYPDTSGSRSADVMDSLPTGEGQSNSMQTAGGEKVTRVDVIDSLPTAWQWDSVKPVGEKVTRVDVIDSVEWRGPVYASTSGAMRVDVIDNIRS
jgi:hypothetical protein